MVLSAAVLAAYLFCLSLLFALVEIEVEGKYGWAERLPTWYRKPTPFLALFTKKPLTGYHLFLQLFMLFGFHLPFVVGVAWSLSAELFVLALLVMFFLLEDFLWFLFNPFYGLKSFKKKNIWWHGASPWVGGLFPVDYLFGVAAAFLLVYFSSWGDLAFWSWFVVLLLLFLLLSLIGSRFYTRWYHLMRTRDDRAESKIFH